MLIVTKNGFGRGQMWMEGIIRGLHRRHNGRNPFRVGGVRRPNFNAHTYTRIHTRGERTILISNDTLWANGLGIFSQAPAHSWPLDTERLRRFAPNSAPHYKASKGLLVER